MEPRILTTPALAKEMTDKQREQLALKVLRNEKPVTQLAEEHNVSRKFIYRQKEKALSGIEQAFDEGNQDDVLYYLPITKAWLRQAVIGLVLHCHSSFRGVIKVFADIFDVSISIGAVHNIIQDAASTASEINANQDLSKVRHGAHDEVFQNNKPVLTGVDPRSLYCYLLSSEDQRDAETWAVHLWDLAEQGFSPDYIIADFAAGLRDGQAKACSDIPCHGDVFHICQPLQKLRRYFANRLKSRQSYLRDIEAKMKKAKENGNGRKYSTKLTVARKDEEKYRKLSTDLNILVSWMEHDVLKTTGEAPKTRRELYDFIVNEIRRLEVKHPHRIRAVRILLKNQRDRVLAFADVLNEKFESLSRKVDVPLYLFWELCKLQRYNPDCQAYHEKAKPLRGVLKHRFYHLQEAVSEAMESIPKASSAVENLHSRLSGYFFLRKQIGHQYLELLRFYLNHTPFLRSAVAERVGKTPAELLTRQQHPHWLEMLGYQRFQAAA